MYLPEQSARYRALKPRADAVIEISPESLAYAADFAVRIGGAPAKPAAASAPQAPSAASPSSTKPVPSGAALILDYGPAGTIPTNSLRGIRAHRPCSPFASPGQVDVSADVDFVALAEAAISASPGVEVHGPVEQAAFLAAMGIRERAEMLVKRAKGDEERKRIEGGWKRLVDRGPQGMGRVYKAMAVVPHVPAGGGRRPVGFGGDISV